MTCKSTVDFKFVSIPVSSTRFTGMLNDGHELALESRQLPPSSNVVILTSSINQASMYSSIKLNLIELIKSGVLPAATMIEQNKLNQAISKMIDMPFDASTIHRYIGRSTPVVTASYVDFEVALFGSEPQPGTWDFIVSRFIMLPHLRALFTGITFKMKDPIFVELKNPTLPSIVDVIAAASVRILMEGIDTALSTKANSSYRSLLSDIANAQLLVTQYICEAGNMASTMLESFIIHQMQVLRPGVVPASVLSAPLVAFISSTFPLKFIGWDEAFGNTYINEYPMAVNIVSRALRNARESATGTAVSALADRGNDLLSALTATDGLLTIAPINLFYPTIATRNDVSKGADGRVCTELSVAMVPYHFTEDEDDVGYVSGALKQFFPSIHTRNSVALNGDLIHSASLAQDWANLYAMAGSPYRLAAPMGRYSLTLYGENHDTERRLSSSNIYTRLFLDGMGAYTIDRNVIPMDCTDVGTPFNTMVFSWNYTHLALPNGSYITKDIGMALTSLAVKTGSGIKGATLRVASALQSVAKTNNSIQITVRRIARHAPMHAFEWYDTLKERGVYVMPFEVAPRLMKTPWKQMYAGLMTAELLRLKEDDKIGYVNYMNSLVRRLDSKLNLVSESVETAMQYANFKNATCGMLCGSELDIRDTLVDILNKRATLIMQLFKVMLFEGTPTSVTGISHIATLGDRDQGVIGELYAFINAAIESGHFPVETWDFDTLIDVPLSLPIEATHSY